MSAPALGQDDESGRAVTDVDAPLDPPPMADADTEVVGLAGTTSRANPQRLRRRLIASDVTAIIVGAILALVGQQIFKPVPTDTRNEELWLTVVIVPIWVLMMGANHLF
ncbi:MAG: hypothetical protein WCA90_00140, partial [Ilumatobacteraceae bacterium]